MKRQLLISISILAGLYTAPTWAQTWDELPKDSQSSLRPLRATWTDLSEAQKKSWLKRVPEFKKMPAEQLESVHERMAEWAALSQQQRTQIQNRLKNNPQSDPTIRAKLWKDYIGQ